MYNLPRKYHVDFSDKIKIENTNSKFFTGVTGSGKTTAMAEIYKQLIKNDFVCFWENQPHAHNHGQGVGPKRHSKPTTQHTTTAEAVVPPEVRAGSAPVHFAEAGWTNPPPPDRGDG